MTTELQIYSFEGNDVRTALIDGEPHWVAKDVCAVLGYVDTVNAVKQHCRGVAKYHPIVDSLGRNQDGRVIAEPDLLRLIVACNLPAAEKFERWVFEDVLPTIRKHGGYLTEAKIEEILTDPDTIIRLATDLKAERQKRLLAEAGLSDATQKIAEDRPKVLFAEAVSETKDCMLVGTLAKLLGQNGMKSKTGKKIGRDGLFEIFREEGYLCRSGRATNTPSQKAMNLNLFRIRGHMWYYCNSDIRGIWPEQKDC